MQIALGKGERGSWALHVTCPALRIESVCSHGKQQKRRKASETKRIKSSKSSHAQRHSGQLRGLCMRWEKTTLRWKTCRKKMHLLHDQTMSWLSSAKFAGEVRLIKMLGFFILKCIFDSVFLFKIVQSSNCGIYNFKPQFFQLSRCKTKISLHLA